MNVRKPVDYSAMFAALDTLMAADLPQTKLYCEIGWVVRSAADRKKGQQSRRRSTCVARTPMFQASLPGTCAGCGSFTVPTRTLQNCWQRP